ncbi:MAG: protein translocase subunit SecD [Parachlamydiaceae bacterium]|nr:protein translocase subunit SecD [Parachlamydiaceae bacterium]
MEKQKRWQFYLILAVILLTLYNILPTLFYYSKPLKEPVNAERAQVVAEQIVNRVNALEGESQEWLYSFSKLLGVKPTTVAVQKDNPGIIEVEFKNSNDANLFKRFLPRAGALIPFAPSQLELYSDQEGASKNTVLVARQIAVRLDPKETDKLFLFSPIRTENGGITDLYREIVSDRTRQLALALAGQTSNATKLTTIVKDPNDKQYDEIVLSLARDIVDVDSTFKDQRPIANRYFASFTQSSENQAESSVGKFTSRLESQAKTVAAEKDILKQEQAGHIKQGMQVDGEQTQQISLLENQEKILTSAAAIIKKNLASFKGLKPLAAAEIDKQLNDGVGKSGSEEQVVNLKDRNPFIESLVIDWANDKIRLQFYPDVQKLRLLPNINESVAYSQGQLNQLIINEIAIASQLTDEQISPSDLTFTVALNNLTDAKSFLAFNLRYISEKRSQEILDTLADQWQPQHQDLSGDVYPLYTMQAFKGLKPEEQKLGLVVYAPASDKESPPAGFHKGSIYVIAKGLDSIVQKYRELPDAVDGQQLMEEFNQLNTMLQKNGFIGYSGAAYGVDPSYSKDYIFELHDYYLPLLKATRENFVVKGSKSFALLDFTDMEQRILTLNKIDDGIQEDLLKWRESYHTSQVDINQTNHYLVPAPTQNAIWENFKLSFIKYFRGDDRKILKWGLDLSGGKTVRIGLRDHNNRVVTNPEDLKQAVNELYVRVNKMGVSERTIHIENDNIILDFPGSQGLSASELIKASAMYFHIVNEKFTPNNAQLKEYVNQFLQNVWNEAVVTNRKDSESINEIAWQHLGGENEFGELTRPRSAIAKILYENGLRLVNPKTTAFSHAYNDTLSAIGILRGEEYTQWEGQTHPLFVVFHNYALEGANLTNVHVGYDSTQGNNLTFGIKGSYGRSQQEYGSPRDDLYTWTSEFSADKIVGTPKDAYSRGHGWRMAVILNGTIISMPTLQAALRDGGTITGRFSQREINQLAADLKAGSLSFTPQILSEENVSPELGAEERTKGIVASIVALVLVVVSMVGYYHFAGVVASCAVLFNILIMWGVLQNLGAALSLPTIAGIVLTIGMAIDANVLVFERIREEFALSGRIASAIQAGYKKAFSAIVDSNITTIIAALILTQFDSGPIKGFAVALIVGVVSSMFTALFMTRYFFAGWVQNPKNKSLRMSQFFGMTNFDFLGQTRKAVIISVILMVLGTGLFFSERHTIFGMDFTGGYSLDVELQDQPGETNYRLKTADALLAQGATSNDIQVRELSRPNQLRIQLGMGMEEKSHPFYQMPEELQDARNTYQFQHNPRITWLVDSLEKAGLKIPENQLTHLEHHWTVMSGQFSEEMRNNALMGLALALISILIYITVRFEFKYAIAAVVGLVHDVIITMGFLALFHWVGFPVQIDLQVIGAIMTIVGYSLNDTIIVFDRIREDIRTMRKLPFRQVVSHALNVTLSRTVMTSGTTLLVLLALVMLGGQSIFAFSLVMTIGVIVGTFSSLFIAAPVMIYFHEREVEQEKQKQISVRT